MGTYLHAVAVIRIDRGKTLSCHSAAILKYLWHIIGKLFWSIKKFTLVSVISVWNIWQKLKLLFFCHSTSIQDCGSLLESLTVIPDTLYHSKMWGNRHTRTHMHTRTHTVPDGHECTYCCWACTYFAIMLQITCSDSQATLNEAEWGDKGVSPQQFAPSSYFFYFLSFLFVWR